MANESKTLSDELPELQDGMVELVQQTLAQSDLTSAAQLPTPIELAHTAVPRAQLKPPPERVRFAVPVRVRLEHRKDEIDGTILNLSSSGLACVHPTGPRVGDTVWCSFRSSLAEAPLETRCEIIWSRPGEGDVVLSGLRFVSLQGEHAERIRAAVAERAEGRASEWSLPVMPSATPARVARGPSPVITGMFGMLAGVVLALVASMVPSIVVGKPESSRAERRVVAPAAELPRRAAEEAQQAQPAEAQPIEAQPAEPQPVEAEAAAPVEPTEAPRAVEAAVEEESPAVMNDESGEARPMEIVELAEPEAPAEALQTTLQPVGTDRSVELALVTDGPVADYKTFWLDSPRRLVIDITGRKSGFKNLEYPIDHALATHLRVGNHHDKVRFVVATSGAVSPHVSARAAGHALVITLRKR